MINLKGLKKDGDNIVLWSGGLDSTYLVWYLLEHGYQVSTRYVEIQNNADKVKQELKARENILPLFRSYKNYRYDSIALSYNEERITESSMCFKQLPLFVFACASLSHSDAILISYVLNDDAISYISEFKKIYNSFMLLSKDSFKIAKLHFPLITEQKERFINELPIEILKHVTWCENPKEDGTICNDCAPCKRYYFLKDRINYCINPKPIEEIPCILEEK